MPAPCRFSQQGANAQSDLTTATQRSAFMDGSHRLSQADKQTYRYNANGQPETVGQREYVWDALGRPLEVRQQERTLAHYQYDHRGLRNAKRVGEQTTHTLYDESRQPLAELDGQGRIQRQYIYLANMALAVIDSPATLTTEDPGIKQVFKDLSTVVQSWLNTDAGLVWLHTNHLGAPEAATDSAGQLVWQASYAPFGAASVQSAGGFTLNLRLPGQYFDGETTLHYNRARYYDPAQGQYLSPDPLGTPDGPNGYAYVRFNPLKYVDPDGLVLFAFDGTGNTPESETNVFQMLRSYDSNDTFDKKILNTTSPDTPTGYYISGPGTSGVQWFDGAIAHTLRRRIDSQLANLDAHIKAKVILTKEAGTTISKDNPVNVDLDIVGFSRGSAAARDFANQVISRRDANYYRDKANGFTGDCVMIELRFMGLFDTVLSTHVGNFNLTIPDAVQSVSHAVARNEFRSKFPLESIEQEFENPGFLGNRTERAFVGAHSDIGGGYNCSDCEGAERGDLSDVALNWMVAQAKSAGVTMLELPDDLKTVSNPVLHDESNAFPFYDPDPKKDRKVGYPDASDGPRREVNSREAPLQGISFEQAEAFVRRPDCLGCPPNVAGAVDMAEYAMWLKENYGLIITN